MGVPDSPAAPVAVSGPSSAGSGDVAAAERVAEFLQQRLRVGAGMLKALQAQIDEMNGLVHDLRQGRQEAEQAVRLYEEKLIAREQALDRIDDRIALAADRAEALSNMVESAEVNLAVLAARAACGTVEPSRAVGRGATSNHG